MEKGLTEGERNTHSRMLGDSRDVRLGILWKRLFWPHSIPGSRQRPLPSGMDWGLNTDGARGREWALVEDKEAWAFIPAFGCQTEPGGARFSSSTSVGRGWGRQKRAT